MDEPALPITGGCACGTVRYEVAAPLVAANYCHCTRCQRRSSECGSAVMSRDPGDHQRISIRMGTSRAPEPNT